MLTQVYKPMEPILKNDFIKSSNFIHQIKWDGIRCITYMDTQIKLRSKNSANITAKYPELERIKSQFSGRNAVLDGEIVILNEKGKPDFNRILKRHMLKTDYKINYYVKTNPVVYVVFDLLFLNDQDLRHLPYIERQKRLSQTYKNSSLSAVTDNFENAAYLFKLMQEKQMEGIVSKDLESPYVSGKNHHFWYKVKIKKKMLVVVGGLKLKNDMPVSMMVGVYNNQHLQYVGNVSSGLSQKDLYLLKNYIKDLKAISSPFYNYTQNQDVVWLKPLLTCTVGFLEKSSTGHLRHPEIIGFNSENPDKATGEERIYQL